MRKSGIITVLALATAWFGQEGFAQGSLRGIRPADVTLAPLFLYTNGPGSISPLQGGQLLTVGQSYELTAVPDDGCLFSSWQPVNVFIFSMTTVNPDGSTNPPAISVVPSLLPESSEQPVLDFTMQAQVLVFNNPGVETITQSSGWQANFVPVPEPSSVALMICGLVAGFVCRPFRRARHAG